MMSREWGVDFWPCGICGKILRTAQDRKKHDLAHHYDYVLAQCSGDVKILKEWAKHD
jgi:hypothetical protein